MGDDWPNAEVLASDFLKTQRGATEPLEIFRMEPFPFLIAARWASGQEYVLVFDGKVQSARGLPLLPVYFAFLGEARLRAMSVGTFRGLLQILDADPERVGPLWTGEGGHRDLAPAIVDRDGVLTYVVHCMDQAPQGPIWGSKPAGSPLFLNRLSLQIIPTIPDLAWKSEERIELPAPAPPLVVPQ